MGIQKRKKIFKQKVNFFSWNGISFDIWHPKTKTASFNFSRPLKIRKEDEQVYRENEIKLHFLISRSRARSVWATIPQLVIPCQLKCKQL